MSQTNTKEMTLPKSMLYVIKTIWNADKGCVIFSFYKNCSEEIFNAFFFVYMTKAIYLCIERKTPYIELVKLIILFCLLQIVIHIVSATYAYYIRLKTPTVYRSIYNNVITKATTIELTRYEQPDFYDKFARALDECLNKAMDALSNMSACLGALLSAVTAIGMIAIVDPVLLLFIFPPVVASFYFGGKQNKEQFELRKEETRDKRTMGYCKRVFYEKKYASEIRLYQMKHLLFHKHRESYKSLYQINVKYRKRIAFFRFIQEVVFLSLTLFGSYVYITYRIKAVGVHQVAAYVAMISAIEFVSWQVKQSIKVGIEAGRYSLYMNNLKEFLEYETVKTQTGAKKVEGNIGDIKFDHVSFQYEGSKYFVIKDLSFTIKKGERIALVGENGAGKTTLIKLLMGLYPVTNGKILAGNTNINEFEPKNYHSHFGTVFQDLQIFALPLSENILMHEPRNEEEKKLVVESLEKAQFGDKLKELPKGIDTMVTKEFDEEGFVCSGGQAQKIAIARVFAKDPDVVILDEPSSALDPIAEYNMYDNMMHVSEGKTVIFISHRLSSARIADKIYFLEHGRIKEVGTHDQLMELNGSYAQMFTLQAKNYRENRVEDKEEAEEMEGMLHA